jgi:hypothetical protein
MTIPYETRTVEPGTLIFSEGSDPDCFYFVQQGRVEISIRGTGGARVAMADVETGDFFGEMSIIDDTTRSATAVASVRTVLLIFARDVLERELGRAELMTMLLRKLSDKLRIINSRLVERSYVDLPEAQSAGGGYHSILTLEPISERMERLMGNRKLGISSLPFTVGNRRDVGIDALGDEDRTLWLEEERTDRFKGPHFEFARQNGMFFLRDLSGTPGTEVNGVLCKSGSDREAASLRIGFNQLIIPGRDATLGFLAYVQ